jgi:hypothetical protein
VLSLSVYNLNIKKNIMIDKTNEQLISKVDFLKGLSEQQSATCLAHFDQIYECQSLTTREENILYLAYLWKHGFLVEHETGNIELDPTVTDVDLSDFDLTIEVPEGEEGGVNLHVTYEFYGVGDLMTILE